MSLQCDFCGKKHVELTSAPPGTANAAGERALLCNACLQYGTAVIHAMTVLFVNRIASEPRKEPT